MNTDHTLTQRRCRRIVAIAIAIWGLVGGRAAGQADRPALPSHAEWVVDVREEKVLSAYLTATPSAASGPAHQRAIHALVVDPALRDAVLPLVEASRRVFVLRELEAADQLRALTKPRVDLPAWTIMAPASVGELRAAYNTAQKATGIGWEYLAAVNFVETKMGRIRGTSTAGAQGPMQFLPATWKIYGRGDINNTNDAIAAAARFLKAKGGPQDMAKALFRYNNSKRYVTAITNYTTNLRENPDLLNDYAAWQVIYRYAPGDVALITGFGG